MVFKAQLTSLFPPAAALTNCKLTIKKRVIKLNLSSRRLIVHIIIKRLLYLEAKAGETIRNKSPIVTL
jgi:hypothetical protein